jgi:hypothetical protein
MLIIIEGIFFLRSRFQKSYWSTNPRQISFYLEHHSIGITELGHLSFSATQGYEDATTPLEGASSVVFSFRSTLRINLSEELDIVDLFMMTLN